MLVDSLVEVSEEWLSSHVSGKKGGSCRLSPNVFEKLLTELNSAFPVKRVAGGAAANTLSALAVWGIHSRLAGVVGEDENGRLCLDTFRAAGGDVSSTKIRPGMPTKRCCCMITPDGERTMRVCLQSDSELHPEELAPNDFENVNFMLFEGFLLYNLPLTMRFFQLAEAHNVPIGMDLSSFELVRSFRPCLLELASRCSVLFANNREICAFLQRDLSTPPQNLLEEMLNYVPCCAMKLGKDGAIIGTRTQTCIVPAEKTRAIDTTGAGDNWAAGFLYGYLRNQPLSLCGRFAAAAAARVVSIRGARLSMADLTALKQQFTIWETQK